MTADKGGRPRLFKSPEAMEESIAGYFLQCKNDKLWPTVAGLTLHLGFSDRSSLIDYQERDEFFHTIKKAKLTIEAALEQRLYEGAPAGAIFNLKNNFGWKDRQEVEKYERNTPFSDIMAEINGEKDNGK